MDELDEIAEHIHQVLEARNAARDRALSQARSLTRHCAHAIRAVHREEAVVVTENLSQAQELVHALQAELSSYPDLYYSGYTQDALKEFAEANIVNALVDGDRIPSPQDLGLEEAAYLNGLAEAVGELRRRCLDILRHGYSQEAERLMENMEDIYAVLITMDYPDAITGGLRRQTDIVRSLMERTRGDLTISLRQQHLEETMHQLEDRLDRE
jgi:translin